MVYWAWCEVSTMFLGLKTAVSDRFLELERYGTSALTFRLQIQSILLLAVIFIFPKCLVKAYLRPFSIPLFLSIRSIFPREYKLTLETPYIARILSTAPFFPASWILWMVRYRALGSSSHICSGVLGSESNRTNYWPVPRYASSSGEWSRSPYSSVRLVPQWLSTHLRSLIRNDASAYSI